MRVIEWPHFIEEGLPDTGSTAMTIGVFDGVHLGHQALIERIVKSGLIPVIITFRENHKKKADRNGQAGERQGQLLSFRQKTDIFERLGVAICVAADLTDSLKNMPGAEFIKLLWERGRMGFLAIGNNFRCGHKLDTDAAKIKQLNDGKNITTDIVEAVMYDSLPISSSRIRSAISAGKLQEAAAMLGRPYKLYNQK